MRIFIVSLLLLVVVTARAAVPTFQSFEPTQFDTNGLRIAYRADWTNEVTVIHPATANTGVVTTNFTDYGTFSLPAKVTLLSLGTNQLDMTLQSTWLLSSPTNDASQVILSLSAGREQGQIAVLSSQNGAESFTLPNQSEQYDVPGAFVYLQGIDWQGTTNRGIILQYTAPDWVEMARFGSTGGPIFTNTPGGGGSSPFTNIAGVVQYTPGQTSTNTLLVTSGAASNSTNLASVVNTASTWTAGKLLALQNHDTNIYFIDHYGSTFIGREAAAIQFADYSDLDWLIGRDISAGDRSTIELVNLVRDSSAENYKTFEDTTISAAASGAQINKFLSASDTSLTSFLDLQAATDTGDSHIDIFHNGAYKFRAKPAISSTGSAVSYLMDTSNVLTNGDKLVNVQNAGAARFAIQHDGSASFSGRTNRLGDDSTRLTYNGSPLITFVYPVACSDETTALTAGTNKVTFRMPFACTLTSVRASLTTAQASGSIFTVDINESGTSILSTKITIDNTEKTSVTAATPPVISDTSIADDAEMTIDVDQVGNGSATGLKVEIYGYQ